MSAPHLVAQRIFSTSSSMLEATALLPMLALIFTRKLRPMIIGSLSGMVDVGGDDRAAAGHFVAHELRGDDAGDAARRKLSPPRSLQFPMACAVRVRGFRGWR